MAAGFDVAFVGVFVPFSKLTTFFDALNEESLGHVATFEEEDAVLVETDVKRNELLTTATSGKLPMRSTDINTMPKAKPRFQSDNSNQRLPG